MLLFFFKQKTAYEMRISDWSSDVCSSDLAAPDESRDRTAVADGRPDRRARRRPAAAAHPRRAETAGHRFRIPRRQCAGQVRGAAGDRKSTRLNSQSLMRISYAVFCLKKKTSSLHLILYEHVYHTIHHT